MFLYIKTKRIMNSLTWSCNKLNLINEGLYYISRDISLNGSKQFCQIDKEKLTKLLETDDFHLYEVIYKGPIRPYFDIDISCSDPAYENFEIHHFVAFLENLFLQDWNFDIDLTILDASNDLKRSYHFIISNCCFSYKTDLKAFVKNHIQPEYPFVDSQCYSSENSIQCFRLVNQSKKGKNNPLRFHKMSLSKKIEDTLITHCQNLPVLPYTGPITKMILNKSFHMETSPSYTTKSLLGDDIQVNQDVIQQQEEYKLCECLDRTRFDNRQDWFRIACILKFCGNPHAFQIWKHVSRKSKKYLEENYEVGGCDYNVWMSIHHSKLSIGTLHFIARSDNPEMYFELTKKDYKSIKKIFEFDHCKILSPLCYIRVNEEGDINILSKKEIQDTYQNLYFTVTEEIKTEESDLIQKKSKKKKFITQWLNDEHIRTYEKMVYDPSMNHNPNYFNRFPGWKVLEYIDVEYNESLLDKVLHFIRYRLCDDHEEFYNWFLMWMACILYRPGQRTQVCPIIKSIEGVGKNLFFDFFGNKILGSYVSTSRSNDIIGKFNSLLQDKVLVCWNETSQKDTFENNERMKEIITDETISIEYKGKNSFTYKNILNFISFTNIGNPFHIDKNDRRFCGIETHHRSMTEEESNEYLEIFNNESTAYTFYKYLGTIDLVSNLSKHRPITDFYRESQMINVNPLYYFFQYYYDQQIESHEETSIVFLYIFYAQYKEWVMNYHSKDGMSYKMFSIHIRKFKYFIEIKRYQSEGKDIKQLHIDVKRLLEELEKYIV